MGCESPSPHSISQSVYAMEEPQSQSLETINRRIIAPAVIFGAVSAWFFQTFIMGSDLFWHLAAGRNIVENGSVPSTDPFSHSFAGKEWLNHEWLWDVIYWNLFDFTPDATAWFTIGLYVVIFTLLFIEAYRTTGSMFASGVVVWLAASAAHWFLDIRPHVISLVFTSVVLATRRIKWIHWTWPVVIVLWTNLHAGFVFGIGLIGLMVLVRTVVDSLEAQEVLIPWPQWIAVGLCLVSWMVNPFTWRLIAYPWEYFKGDTVYKGLVEWHPPIFALNPYFFEGSFWWLVLLMIFGAYCYRSKVPVWLSLSIIATSAVLCSLKDSKILDTTREDPTTVPFYLYMFLAIWFGDRKQKYLIALNAVTLMMACESRRFIPLCCVTATPLAAQGVLYLRDQLVGFVPQLKSHWAGVGASLVALLIGATMWSQIRFGESLLRDWAMADKYPEEQVAWINEVKPGKRVFNRYNWGGYLMLFAPGYKTIFDGRANTLYDDEMYKMFYHRFMQGILKPAEFSRYPTDFVLDIDGRLRRGLQKLPEPWKLIHQGRGVILLPPDSPLLEQDFPTVEEVVPDGVEAHLSRATILKTTGKTEEAIELLKEAAETFYYETRLYTFLCAIYAEQKDYEGIAETIESAVERNPRRSASFRSLEARIFERAGQWERALAAYKHRRVPRPVWRPPSAQANSRENREAEKDCAEGQPLAANRFPINTVQVADRQQKVAGTQFRTLDVVPLHQRHLVNNLRHLR